MSRRIRVGGQALVAKSRTGRLRTQLRLEAELLDHLVGLPVVRVVALRESDERTDLVTADAGARDLSNPLGMEPHTLVAALARTATAVAALHTAGWCHGALCASHVVISTAGEATLCSLGSARPLSTRPTGAAEDLEQLVHTLRSTLDHVDPAWSAAQRRRWRHLARQMERRLRPPQVRDDVPTLPTAATIAKFLEQLAATPIPSTVPERVALSPGTRRLVGAATAACLVLLAWGAMDRAPRSRVGAMQLDQPAPLTEPAAPPEPADSQRFCSAATPGDPVLDADGDGCPEPVELDGNRLTIDGVTYRAGRPDDLVTVAPLDCEEPARILTIRPSTGEVFAFSELPAEGRSVGAELLATVPGATALELADEPCTRAVVRTAQGLTASLAPDQGATPATAAAEPRQDSDPGQDPQDTP